MHYKGKKSARLLSPLSLYTLFLRCCAFITLIMINGKQLGGRVYVKRVGIGTSRNPLYYGGYAREGGITGTAWEEVVPAHVQLHCEI